MSELFTLYGMELSLYTGKARSYLRYKQIPFQETVATREIYKSVLIPNVGMPIVPVVETPEGEFVQDTSDIIDYLEQRFVQRPVYPSTPKQKLAALLLEQFADEWLVIPAMHFRWHFPDYNEAYLEREFGASSAPDISEPEQRAVGRKTGAMFKSFAPALGATPDMYEAIESWYSEMLTQLNSHFGKHRFLLGDAPSLADFGFMGPMYAHLARDPYPMLMMQRDAPNVYQWVTRMRILDELSFGELLADDEISPEIEAIITRMFKEQFPFLKNLVEQLAQWQQANPEEKIPRLIGTGDFTIGESTGQRMMSPFNQWMLQRPLDYYAQLQAEQKLGVDQWLATVGGEQAIKLNIKSRVARVNNKLVFEPSSGSA